MLGVGILELLLIFVVALLVLGPDQLPKVARTLAKMLFEFRQVSEDLRLTVMSADREISIQTPSADSPADTANYKSTH